MGNALDSYVSASTGADWVANEPKMKGDAKETGVVYSGMKGSRDKQLSTTLPFAKT